MTDPARPLVYLVDDDHAFRDSLQWLLESAGYQVATFATAEHFLACYPLRAGACLVLDLRMPGLSGIQLQEEMLRRGELIPIVFVTGHGDVPVAVNAMKRGAFDFIEKPFNHRRFLEIVRAAIDGGGPQLRDKSRHLAASARIATLTQREREIMSLIVTGKQNKVIAYELGISVRTVEAHRAKIMEKTATTTVAELVQVAIDGRPQQGDS